LRFKVTVSWGVRYIPFLQRWLHMMLGAYRSKGHRGMDRCGSPAASD